ncbi:putative RNA polymerase II subunit B1 CTD like protein [Argiope bruennichi]|uniref:Putative RNA polymerase II subunit B1 CTD like protein n=2 Tax=Argiope bruennichi TaxID=94029 RepID=A0A8T0F8U5_ARGBR|nr:putative RNA polymerase II subunit B1 CTD like protein [Argiope bruennichi]
MRKTETELKKFQLLCDSDNKGSAGDEVVFRRSLSKDEVENAVPPEIFDNNNHLSNILQNEVKGWEQQLAELKITEKVYEKPFVFGSMKQEKSAKDENNLFSESSEEDEDEDFEDDRTKNLFPDYVNLAVLSNKHMPIPEKTKKTVVISPIKPVSSPESPSIKVSMELVNNVFQNWFTEDTMKYLLGEKKVYSIKADKLLQTLVSSEEAPSSSKLSLIKKEYIELCLKIDSLKDDDDISNSDEEDILDVYSSKSKETDPEVLCIKSIPEIKSAPKPRPKRKSKGKKKTVSFKEQIEKEEKKIPKAFEDMIKDFESSANNCGASSESNDPLPEPAFPLIDSVSQNALRKQLVISRLKTVYFDMLPIIGLHYRDIRDGVMRIAETFSLTPSTVYYKTKEWKCIALVLFRILSRTTLQDLEQQENFNFSKLCESVTKQLNISVSEIENLASDLISPEQVERIQGSYEV